MDNNNFIPRKFKNTETNKTVTFEEVVNSSNISVILGEPASGKTYQLKMYSNKDNNYFVELINIEDEDDIEENISLVLLDSIDEALVDYSNPKKLKSKLSKFIIKCKKRNSNIRFLITCRYLEWKKDFEEELKKLDDELKVYEILPLTKNDINQLLEKKQIKAFWSCINNNYLEPLLKNIMITLYLVEHFETYDKSSNYTTIYEEIIKEYITKVGENREEENTNRGLDKLILIASSLATYMTLNKKLSISSLELNKIASECYKIDDTSLVADDLSTILSTAIFEKKDNKFAFFHKSIQEYLTAYFVNKKELDIETIKTLFAHKLRFYEEFEEVIIYLTNIEHEYFKYILDFDPFIFRRHPSLDKEQQHKLLISTLKKIKYEEWMIDSNKNDFGKWGTSRWKVLNRSTIFKYNKLSPSNLYGLVVHNVEDNISLTTFTFLIKLIEFNQSEELEDYILELLEKKISSESQIEYILNGFKLTGTFNQKCSFNLKIFNFIYKNNFFQESYRNNILKEEERKTFDIFMGEFIRLLYIKKNKCKKIDFNIIFNLSNGNAYGLSKLVPLFEVEETREWLAFTLQVFEKYGYTNLSRCHPNWLLYSLLKNKIDLNEILGFLDKYPKIEKPFRNQEMLLDIDHIKDSFWDLFFNYNEDEKKLILFAKILTFYRPNDFSNIIKKYPIKDFLKSYFILSNFFNIDKILEKYIKANSNE